MNGRTGNAGMRRREEFSVKFSRERIILLSFPRRTALRFTVRQNDEILRVNFSATCPGAAN